MYGMIYTQNSTELINAFSQSYQLEGEGKFEEAIQALQPFPSGESYEINLRMGWLFYNKGDYFTAEKHYKAAMELMPYAIEARFGYVLPVAAMGNWTLVENTYKEILKIDPQNTLANYRLGAIYYERKNYEQAYKHVERVVNLYPFDYDSVVLFAWINFQRGSVGKAKVLFEKALMIMPGAESAKEGLKMLQ
jgi:tetratricopeptide (TPR) repeat protein